MQYMYIPGPWAVLNLLHVPPFHTVPVQIGVGKTYIWGGGGGGADRMIIFHACTCS